MIPTEDTRKKLNAKRLATLEKLLRVPPPADLRFDDLVSLLEALGARKREGRGSRVSFIFEGDRILTMHSPHPHSTVVKGAVKQTVIFLTELGYLRHE